MLTITLGIADGEKATTVSLYTPSKSAESGLRILDTFQPKFMDTIFDDGKVFGYKDLKINIRYRANDMRPHVKVAYKEKTKPIGDREADDIPEILQEGRHLPQGKTLPQRSTYGVGSNKYC